jgi:hypothetical protein
MDAGNGKIWVGTGNGLNIFDPQQETFSMLYPNGIPRFKKGNGLFAIRIDTSVNKAWLERRWHLRNEYVHKTMPALLFKDSNNQVISGLHEGYPRQFRNGLLLSSGFQWSCRDLYSRRTILLPARYYLFLKIVLDVFKVYTNEKRQNISYCSQK